jgi:SAM-dependent methyltransferase
MSNLDTTESGTSPERFDPAAMAGGLMEAEHRARYWWAGQWVEGKRVLDAGCGVGYGSRMLAQRRPDSLAAVDISEEALAEARGLLGDDFELQRADIRDLPFDSESFDVVVCFEVIEHVERQAEAIAEFKRVLRRDGMLLISSPNSDVYPPGDPHHVREYSPEELRAELLAEFDTVSLHRQHPWLASAVLPEHALPLDPPEPALLASTGEDVPPTYTVAVASDSPHARPHGIVVISDDFEVRWWHEQVDRLGRAAHSNGRAAAELGHELERLSRNLLESEQAAARAVQSEHRLEQLEEEYARLMERAIYCEYVIDDMKDSVSWRLTAPLRKAKTLLSWSGRRSAP